MSRSPLVDFNLDASDHGCLQVSVVTLGETGENPSFVRAVMGALRELPPVQYQGSVLFLRFLDSLPRWAKPESGWEDFAAYKQVHGVLAVALCEEEDDLVWVSKNFKVECERHPRSLCSLCLVFGPKKILLEPSKRVYRPEFRVLDRISEREAFSRQDFDLKEVEQVVNELAVAICRGLSSRVESLAGSRAEQLQRLVRSPTIQEGDEAAETRCGEGEREEGGRYFAHV